MPASDPLPAPKPYMPPALDWFVYTSMAATEGSAFWRDGLCQRLVGLGVGSVDAAGVLRTQLRRRRRGSGIVTARSGLPDAEAAQTDGAGDGGTAEGEQERASAVRLLLDGHSSCRMLRVLRLLIVLLLLLIIRLLPHGGGMLGMLVACVGGTGPLPGVLPCVSVMCFTLLRFVLVYDRQAFHFLNAVTLARSFPDQRRFASKCHLLRHGITPFGVRNATELYTRRRTRATHAARTADFPKNFATRSGRRM